MIIIPIQNNILFNHPTIILKINNIEYLFNLDKITQLNNIKYGYYIPIDKIKLNIDLKSFP